MSEQIGTVSMLLGLDPKAASDHRLDPGEMLDVARRIAGVLRGTLPVRHLPRASAETLAALGGTLSKPTCRSMVEQRMLSLGRGCHCEFCALPDERR